MKASDIINSYRIGKISSGEAKSLLRKINSKKQKVIYDRLGYLRDFVDKLVINQQKDIHDFKELENVKGANHERESF